MITDHTRTSTERKGMVSGNMKAAIPAALGHASQKQLDKLRDTKPDDFPSQYDPMQVRLTRMRCPSRRIKHEKHSRATSRRG
jgi:predicted outer membrane protein